jgi:predicted ATP-binding protein involved in virulence
MNGHPAIAYLVVQRMLEERRSEASSHRRSKEAAQRQRSVKLGSYRLTLSKETSGVPRTV